MTRSKDSPMVTIRGVRKAFESDRTSLVALEDINLDVYPGEFLSLIGPSGCGKSTLLRLIGGLLSPTEGEIQINNKPPDQARRDRDYGIVFQSPVLFDWRTVERNVSLPLEVFGTDSGRHRQIAHEMLELVELEGFENHYPWQLSGGMQQRVSIARALAFQPSILLMDEPFGALDEMTRERMNALLLQLWDKMHKTVVFVTHSIPEAVFLSNRVAVMSPRPGRIVDIVEVDLPHPRDEDTRESDRYFDMVTQVRESLRSVQRNIEALGEGK